jgi:hypothetical protein
VRLAFDRLRKPLEARDERAVEALEPADALELGEAALGVGHEAIDVDLHAATPERLEVGDPPSPQPPGAAGVAATQVLEADADLQDALVEVADRVALLEPLELEGFVLLEELTAVELLDAAAEPRRRGSPQRPERCPRPGRWGGASLIRPSTLGTQAAVALHGGCCKKPSRKRCSTFAEMGVRGAGCDGVDTDRRRLTDAMADFGAHP